MYEFNTMIPWSTFILLDVEPGEQIRKKLGMSSTPGQTSLIELCMFVIV